MNPLLKRTIISVSVWMSLLIVVLILYFTPLRPYVVRLLTGPYTTYTVIGLAAVYLIATVLIRSHQGRGR